MKKHILCSSILVLALALATTMTSCLDYDNPGDEASYNESDAGDVVNYGAADSINYHVAATTQQGFRAAKDSLKICLGQMKSAQYSMRGGKENGFPEAHAYQYQFSLGTDNYCGFFTAPQNFDGRLKSTLYVYDSFNSGPNGHFLLVKNGLVPLLNHPQVDSIPEIKAMALLLLDYSAQEVTDIYGAMPFSDYKANKQENPFTYDSGRDIYMDILDDLDTINACLTHYQTRPSWYKSGIDDILINDELDWITKAYQIETWRRLANSLKLRMAMHMVDVDATLAQRLAEEAVRDGVVESVDDESGLFPTLFGFTNPLSTISESWNDTRLGASFESILASLNHPYMQYLWQPNSGDLYGTDGTLTLPANTRVVGLRAGIQMLSTQVYATNHRCAYSRLSKNVIAAAPLYLMKMSEVDFLRAEGAIRGWDMGGTAEFFYQRGIRNAYLDDRDNASPLYRNAMDTYMAQEQATPYTYTDPMNERYNAESLTHIGVKWNDGDDFETKLEKIITQKYIAAFPYSFEAWTDLRRTGYPHIFPILNVRDGDRSLKYGDLIRRMPFPGSTDNNTAKDIQDTGLKALGGPDEQATRIWWDVH